MRDHIVALVEEEQPRRVTCQTCNGTHLYRPNPPRSRSTTGSRGSKLSSQTAEWEDLMAMADLEKVRPYAMSRAFSAGDVVSHKVFGIGIVVQEVDERKVQISFQDGVRLLACNHRRS